MTVQAYADIVVVGGGCYGSYYVRQLARAARAGAVSWERLLVVDRNAECPAVSGDWPPLDSQQTPPELVTAEWRDFFASYLPEREAVQSTGPRDAIVPSPLMPHLMFDWIRERATRRWPGRSVATPALSTAPQVPWERAAPGGTHYVSFAEWTCPTNCIEPDRCPHTRGPRSWTMPRALEDYVQARRAAGENLLGPLVFHCTHRAYGVGMIDTDAVLAADRLVAREAAETPAAFLIGTVSHCHGALNVLAVS